jgi:ATP-binding cassette, subfamily A (ABC1), member 3
VLLGLLLASWSFFVAAPFGKSPQLAAVVSTFLSIAYVLIPLVMSHASNGAAFIFTIIFPPGFYIFAIRAIAGYENHLLPTDALRGDPDNGLVLLPLLIAAIVTIRSHPIHYTISDFRPFQIDIFLWPYLAVLLERRMYDATDPAVRSWMFWKKQNINNLLIPDNVAISVRNLKKVFKTSIFSSNSVITAISDLTFDIPKSGLFVLLGSNG